jgi:hypothetical protein
MERDRHIIIIAIILLLKGNGVVSSCAMNIPSTKNTCKGQLRHPIIYQRAAVSFKLNRIVAAIQEGICCINVFLATGVNFSRFQARHGDGSLKVIIQGCSTGRSKQRTVVVGFGAWHCVVDNVRNIIICLIF